jgi:hypothetical protein
VALIQASWGRIYRQRTAAATVELSSHGHGDRSHDEHKLADGRSTASSREEKIIPYSFVSVTLLSKRSSAVRWRLAFLCNINEDALTSYLLAVGSHASTSFIIASSCALSRILVGWTALRK